MKRLLSPLVLLLAALAGPLHAAFPESYIYIDVGFKILVKSDGETTQRPIAGGGNYNPADPTQANADADAMLDSVNRLSINGMMNPQLRGLRYRRYGNVQFVRADVAGVNATLKSRIDSMFRSNYAAGALGDLAYTNFKPASKLLDYAKGNSDWLWSNDRANFYLTNGYGGGVGFYPENLMFQGGFWVDPGTHELGHWLSLPHTFRTGGGPADGSVYWGDQEAPGEHGDGFTDTLIDHVNGVQTLNSLAGYYFKDGDGLPRTYTSLSVADKTTVQGKFRDYYAKQYYNISSYDSLTAAQKLRIPVFDTSAPAPTAADRDPLAIHIYGVPFADLPTADQNGITNAIAAPNATWWIGSARYGAWYCKVDDDLIARHDYGEFYDEVEAWQREQMRLLNANIMAYRAGKGSPFGIFSEQQLDRMCDVVSGRNTVTTDRGPTRSLETGRFFFIGGPTVSTTYTYGSSLYPGSGLLSIALFAGDRDVILARPGNYPLPSPQPMTISRPMSIRATHAGPAVFGKQ